MEKIIMAKIIYKLGDDISTDIIYPGRYMATVLPSETPEFAFEDIKELNQLLKSTKGNDEEIVIAGGWNFGCGSSREQAASTLKGYGKLTVIAKSISRIFLQNGINLGLNMVICPDLESDLNDELLISNDKVINKTKNKEFSIEALPISKQAVINAGGLVEYTRKRLSDKK